MQAELCHSIAGTASRSHSKHQQAQASTSQQAQQRWRLETGDWVKTEDWRLDGVLTSFRLPSPSARPRPPSPFRSPPSRCWRWPVQDSTHCRGHPSQANVDCSAHWEDKGPRDEGVCTAQPNSALPHHHTLNAHDMHLRQRTCGTSIDYT